MVILGVLAMLLLVALSITVLKVAIDDNGTVMGLLLWAFTPVTLIIWALVSETKAYGAKKAWLGFSKEEFEAMIRQDA